MTEGHQESNESNNQPANESPREPLGVQPPKRGLPGTPSRGCLIFGLVCLGGLGLLFLINGPCFFEAQTRARVARVESDMRALAWALDSYARQEQAYPPCTLGAPADNAPGGRASANKAPAKRKDAANAITTFALQADGRDYLVSPKSYINNVGSVSVMPLDVFSVEPKTHYGYYTTGQSWVLFSAGPDGVYDLTDPARLAKKPDGTLDPDQFVDLTYDPSNGTNSRGDVFRFGGMERKQDTPETKQESEKASDGRA